MPHSTPEAEILATNLAMRALGIRALSIWDMILEDNDATMLIIQTGKTPTLRHISRTHGVNVAWLHEVFQRPEFRWRDQPTLGPCSDIFTKPLTAAAAWRRACDLVGIISDDVAGKGRGGGSALQAWADRARAAQSPGLSEAGGE